MKKKLLLSFKIFLFLILSSHYLNAAEIDNFYTLLLKQGQYLYSTEARYFGMYEKGVHGSASFDGFDSYPHSAAFYNALRFSPLDSLDMEIGYGHTFSDSYIRPTRSTLGVVTSFQRYKLDYFQDFFFKLNARRKSTEIYLDIVEKRQKTNWSYTGSRDSQPNYFNYFHSNYEDFKLGLQYLSVEKVTSEVSGLSNWSRSLLGDGQFNIETEAGYRNGRLDRSGTLYVSPPADYNYVHHARAHILPKVRFRYGFNDNLELESGVGYTTPFKYSYEYKFYRTTSNFINGTYKTGNNFDIPVKLIYRPKNNWELKFSSDFNVRRQRLDYWEKETDDSITTYETKKLGYYNVRPTLALTYLSKAKEEIKKMDIPEARNSFLRKNQFLWGFQLEKDITYLNKGSSNGTQNVLDPYNVFLYPVDFFVTGSEYAAYFSGNSATTPANVSPQNFYKTEMSFIYGLKDTFNIGLTSGYHSGSAVHQFSLSDLADRFFLFKPYYYVDLLSDWQVTPASFISFNLHFVPQYKTRMTSSVHPQDFRVEARYLSASLGYKIRF